MENSLRREKTHFNITTTLKVYIPIIRTKDIRPYIIGLIIYLKDLLIRLLIFRGHIGKVI